MYILIAQMPIKSFKKIYLRKKTEGILLFIVSVLFCSEIETRYTLCVRYTLFAG
jgi:hypothetical protein